MKKGRIIFALAFICLNVAATAQPAERRISRDEYINLWKDVAIQHMHQYGIPASITLAQGILESAHGNSNLAKYGNNHFGIKCHNGWTGETMHADDDAPNECFRKYKTAEESYNDHAEFLKKNSRYHFLFNYASNDYSSWAYGLKKAGYATSATYATALIKVIEDNKLYEFDQLVNAESLPVTAISPALTRPEPVNHPVKVHDNGIRYVIVKKGDTYYKIAKEFDMGLWQLYKYNDVSKDDVLMPGDVLYLQAKKGKNTKAKAHVVKAGETLRDISQQYGVKLEKLKKRNDLEDDDVIKAGDKLVLKGHRR
jgi:LysM repeat protein